MVFRRVAIKDIIDELLPDGFREDQSFATCRRRTDRFGKSPPVSDDSVGIQDDDAHRSKSSSSEATRRKSVCDMSSLPLASR